MNRFPNTPRHQRGAALIIGLLMLLVLTLIGVSNMSMTTVELRMAANQQNKNHAFQAAESGIETAIPLVNYANINSAQTITPPVLSYAQVAVQADFVLSNNCPGQSLTRGLQCNHFQIDSVGQHLQSNASSAQAQGVYRLAPSMGP